ncbi:hypothetical protein A5742_17695 [Mycolicibacterium fortuitum]|uniref:Uncharacterized protein n=2 Tax=Mycolicibacterium fortuitum TaxID=1766 RepID=A0ABD6QT28_MYCFO|nr:hypothetical protein A5742_17695 [Mycolicibacterium fortuitum]
MGSASDQRKVHLTMPLTFTPEAAERLTTLSASSNAYDQAVLAAVKTILSQLELHPERHRVGASQFTEPTAWGRIVDVDDGAGWMVLWTIGEKPGGIRILRVEPAPSLG